jgi:hypothetical protein
MKMSRFRAVKRSGSGKALLDSQHMAMKRIADDILEKLGAKGLEAVVAGGMPRDYILNQKNLAVREINDIDVYIKVPKGFKEVNTYTLNSRGFEKVNSRYKGINKMKAVYSGTYTYGIEGAWTQLIFVECDNLRDYVNEHFDLSICQVVYKDGKFIELPDFRKTIETGIVTFNPRLDMKSLEYSFNQGHIKKIFFKFREKFTFDGLTKDNFLEYGYRAKAINRTKLADKMAKNVVFKTKDYLLIKELR